MLHLCAVTRSEIISIVIALTSMNPKNIEESDCTEELSEDLWLERGIVPECMQLFCGGIVAVRLLENVSEVLAMLLKQCVASWIP